jgi:uncharacterized protein (TIGR00269 family)
MSASICTKCKRDGSIYHRPYSGERLCTKCFKASIIERVQKTINLHDMLKHDCRIAVGVSGGKDSLTLLHVLKEIEEGSHGSELVAITVDEGIHCYREEALSIVDRNIKALGIEWIKVSFNELFGTTLDALAAEERPLTACSYCGVLRRRALNEVARSVGADRLATGHTLDDMAQSALLNLIRGDLSKMSSLNPGGFSQKGFVRRIKPLCEVPERETTLYAYLSGFDFQSIACPYSEEAMRNDARNWLAIMEEKRPGTMYTTFHTALKLIPKVEKAEMNNCRFCNEPTAGDSCRVCQIILNGKLRV